MYKILIVDDNAVMRGEIRRFIEEQTDWTICGEAENGQVALGMVPALQPDLVILDSSMPIMNGLDTAREISRIAPGMPMIIFTGFYDNELKEEEAKQVGVKHVFAKMDGFGENVIEAMRAMLPAPNRASRVPAA